MDYLQYLKDLFVYHQLMRVLNLIINGLPSILNWDVDGIIELPEDLVLNLIINGLPSILKKANTYSDEDILF